LEPLPWSALFVGAITGALQVLLRNRDSNSEMVEQRLGQPLQ
jgi:hypothetical protein